MIVLVASSLDALRFPSATMFDGGVVLEVRRVRITKMAHLLASGLGLRVIGVVKYEEGDTEELIRAVTRRVESTVAVHPETTPLLGFTT